MSYVLIEHERSGTTREFGFNNMSSVYKHVAAWRNPRDISVVIIDKNDDVLGQKEFDMLKVMYNRGR